VRPEPLSTPSNVAGLGERAAIDLIRRRLPAAPPWVVVGIGDDAAVAEPARNALDVFTTDALVEGVHFDRRFTPPSAIGHRAMAANLSDLAAMGATPRLALLSLALPGALPVVDLEALVDGLLALATHHGVHLVGGNITRSPGPLVVDITAVGSVRRRHALTRPGARPGDDVWVSGTIGAAAAGLAMLASGDATAGPEDAAVCAGAYLAPTPRVRLGTLLGRNRAASSCMDLSDGLADGLAQLAAASEVALEVDPDAVPVAPAAASWFRRAGADPLQSAMGGGDDYELLFTVSRRRRSRFEAVRKLTRDVPVTKIGRVATGSGAWLVRGDSRTPVAGGYEHFR
jgi:thiamine-monophosphate kinase